MGLPQMTAIRGRFEALLADACTVTHDPTGEANATLDRSTGAITGGASDASTTGPYPCLVRSTSASRSKQNEESLSINIFDILMRSEDPAPALGDEVTITASQLNPALVGRTFAVVSVDTTSLNFAQLIRAQDVLPSPAMP